MPKNFLKSNHVFKLHVDVMLEKLVQTQVPEIPSHLQIVVTSIMSSCNNAMFLTPSHTVLPGTLPCCFHLSTFLSFFPPLCAVVKKIPIVKSIRWSLLDSGNCSEFILTYWILDVVQCCFFSVQKMEAFFPTKGMSSRFSYTCYFVTNFLCYRIQVIQIHFQLLIHFIVFRVIWYQNVNNRYSRGIFIVRTFVWLSFWRSCSFNNCKFCWIIAAVTPLRKVLRNRLHFYSYYMDHNFGLKFIYFSYLKNLSS